MSNGSKNKVLEGLTNVHYSILTYDESGNEIFSKPERLEGAKNIGATDTFAEGSEYADNKLSIYKKKQTGADLALEFLNISREIESKLTGKLYKTGEMVSRSTDIQPQVAIMYTRTFSDESYENIVYYNCKLAKTDESTGTTTDGIEFKITTFDGKASPLSNGDIKYVISSDEVGADNTESKKKLDNFFKTVQFFDKEDTTLE